MPIEVTGAKEIARTLVQLDKAMNPTVELMGDIARIIYDDIQQTFDMQGRGKWAPQAPSTRPGVGGTLEFTGKGRQSIEPKVGKNYAEARPSNAVYKYMAVNHYGSKSGRIPARPFMYISQEGQDKIVKRMEQPIDEAMKK